MNDSEIELYFKNNEKKNLVSEKFFQLYKASIITHDFSLNPYLSFIDRILVYYHTIGSIFQSHIVFHEKEVFQFGIEIEKKDNYISYYKLHKHENSPLYIEQNFEFRKIKEIKHGEDSFNLFSVNHKDDKKFLMFNVVPISVIDYVKSIQSIVNISYKYYTGMLVRNDSNYIPLFTNFKENLKNKILSYPYKGRIRGVIAHFKIEDLSSYIEVMGEEFSKKIINEIKLTIQKKLKKSDLFYVLSGRTYLAYLPDCDVEPVIERFQDVYFKIDPMTIQYKLDFYEIKPSNIDDLNYFDKLLGNEISVVQSIGLL